MMMTPAANAASREFLARSRFDIAAFKWARAPTLRDDYKTPAALPGAYQSPLPIFLLAQSALAPGAPIANGMLSLRLTFLAAMCAASNA